MRVAHHIHLAEQRLTAHFYFEVMGATVEPLNITRSQAGEEGRTFRTNVNFLHQIF